jgi:hypothetical protein
MARKGRKEKKRKYLASSIALYKRSEKGKDVK